jgi:hypothetical protein
VERTPDPDDGRAALVAITDRGREQVRAVLEQDAQRLAARLEGWDEEQARTSRGAINEITTVFLDSLGVERTTSCRGRREPGRLGAAADGDDADRGQAAPEHTGRQNTDQDHADREHEEQTAP